MISNSMVKRPQKVFYANKERVKNLKLLLVNHSDILKNLKGKNQIIRSFKFKNKVAFIELYDKRTERRTKLIEELGEFFFVGELYFYPEPKESILFGMIIVSRFKDLLNIAMYYAKKFKGQFEKVPDLSWILFNTPFQFISK